MSTSQVLSVVGYAVGFYFGGPAGGSAGALIGGIAGSAIDPQTFDVPKVGDLKAPQMQYGSKLLRLYGSNRVSGTLAWYSEKRVIEGDDGGKGEPSAPTADTAEIDVLYLFSVDSEIIAITRVWKNGEVVWSNHASSDASSIAASATQSNWTQLDFLDGNPAQLPHPTIEASDGVGNVSAYRHRQGAMITGLQLGQSGQLPLIEFETVQRGTLSPARTKLESYFEQDLGTSDISAYHIGPATLGDQASVPIGGGSLDINATGAPNDGTATWTSANLTHDGATPTTIEFFLTWSHTKNEIPIPAMTWTPNTLDGGTFDRIQFAGPDGYWQWVAGGYESPVPLTSEAHFRIVYTPTMSTLYFNGAPVSTGPGLPGVPGAVGKIVLGCVNGSMAEPNAFSFRAFAFRAYEMNTGPFSVPAQLDPPDGETITPEAVDLADIVGAEWERVSEASKIDASDLIGIPVRGFQTGGSVRGAIEALGSIFHFGSYCTDKLYFKRLGGSPAATLTFDELAAGEDKPADEPFAPETMNEEEIPERVVLTFPDYSNDYNAGSQTGNRGTGTSSIVQATQTNVVMTPSEGKAVAEIAAALAGIEATTGAIALTDYHADKVPTDVLLVPDEDGNVYRVRIGRDTYGGGVHQLEWRLDDPHALEAEGITSGPGGNAFTVQKLVGTLLLPLDIPTLIDSNAPTPGWYAAAKPAEVGKWQGWRLYESSDDASYTKLLESSAKCIFGSCQTTLDDWTSGWFFDERSTVTVDVGVGELSSSTRDALIADETANACAIGVDGRWELCQFRTADLVSPGIYILSGFLRGARGTERFSTGHGSDESFVLLNTSLRRVDQQNSEVGVDEYLKAVTFGKSVASADSQVFSNDAVNQLCFAPVALRAAVGSTDTVFDWTRRTRLSTRFASTSGMSAPLGETSESYYVELRDASDVLIDSDTVSVPEWSSPNTSISGYTFSVTQIGANGAGTPAILEL